MSSATTTLRMILLGEDKSASKALQGVGSEADTTTSKMDKFHKVGTAAGVALAGGLVLAGKAAIDMTKTAAADQLSASKMAQTFHEAAHATDAQVASTENWITAQGKTLGVTKDELRPALSKLAIATGSVSKAQKLASLAMDISAARGVSLASVSQALAKAQTGNISGLSRLGIATKDAAGNTLTLHQVTKKMTATYTGAAANAATTVAGKQKILATQIDDLQIKIGTALIPVMQHLVSVGLTVVEWVTKNTKLVGVIVAVLGTLVAVTWAVSAAIKAWAAITKIATAVQWLFNAAMDANPIALVVIGLAALVVALVVAYKKSETFRHIVQGAFHAVQAAAAFAFGWVKKNWPLLLIILTGVFGIAVVVIAKHWAAIKAGVANVIGWVKSHWPLILAILTGPIGLATLFIVRKWGDIKAGAQSVVTFIAGIPGKLSNLAARFGAAGHSLIQAFVDGMKNASGIISGIAGNVWTAVRGLINGAIDKINSALNFSISLPGPDIHVNAGQIPHLAAGGIVTRPTRALIGEAGPEAVIPLSGARGKAMLGGGGVTVNVYASNMVDPQSTARLIETELAKLKRQRGASQLAFQ